MKPKDETIAWVCCRDIISPWSTTVAKTFYRVILRTSMCDGNLCYGIYLQTASISGENREVKVYYKFKDESKLRNILHTVVGRTEVARAITILIQCSWIDKKVTRNHILDDMVFLEPPFDISYVDNCAIYPGTIVNILSDHTDNRTNRFVIRPKDKPTEITKLYGEINIPFRNWKKNETIRET